MLAIGLRLFDDLIDDFSNLDDGGELLHLVDASDQTIAEFTYDDDETMGWPSGPDGEGYALVIRNPESGGDPDLAGSWRSSGRPGGQPGLDDRVTLDSWKASNFDAAQLADPGVSGDLADPDLDGLTNFVEFMLAGDPLVADRHRGVEVRLVEVDGKDHLAIVFRRWLAAEELTTTVQSSADGITWMDAAVAIESISLGGDGTQTEVWRSTDPVTSASVELLRVMGTLDP